MAIRVQCPSCEKSLKAKDEFAGKRIKCPGCGKVIVAPAAPADPLRTTDQAPDPDATGERVSGLASTPGERPAGTFDADAADDLPTVPGYRVLHEIARGGMGRVLAAQDLTLDREVALKILLPGANADRFVRESKITARLPHPGIPPIYALGTLTDGSPFLAMKLVAGQTLAVELTTADRPRLFQVFAQVCQAVGFAHSRGVIHRDLKPANVMVGAFGEVQVMDWGLAKELPIEDCRLQIEGEEESSNLQSAICNLQSGETQAGSVMGTPAYMAPEQARGEAADARADVFALGGILCMILTGAAPFGGRSPGEIVQRAAAGDLDEALARLDDCGADAELVALCRRCLSPSPVDRPADGQAVADELTAYLNGVQERLQAAERERAVAVAKTIEERWRRRVQVIAASLVLFVLLAGIAGTTWGLFEANRSAEGERLARQDAQEKEKLAVEQRTRAEKARDRTRDVLDAMTSEVAGDSLSTQKEISADQKKFLTEVLTYYREFAGEQADDEETRARTAQAAFRVGLIEYRLGRTEQAIAAFQMARDGYGTLAADFPAVPDYRQGLAGSHNSLGLLRAGLGEPAEAEEHYRKAIAIQVKLAADFPAVPEYRNLLALSHNNLGGLLADLGKRAEAAGQFRKALAIREKLAADFPAVPNYRHELAGSHNNLGLLLAGLGKRAEAEEQYRQALAIQEKLAADFPAVPDYRDLLARSHNNLGSLLDGLGKRAEEEEQFRKALAIREKLAADFPAVPNYRHELAGSHNNLGSLLNDLGQRAEAEEQYRKAIAIQEKLAADFPALPDHRKWLALSHNILGSLLNDLGQRAEAEEQYRKAIVIQEKLAADFPAVPDYRQKLATSHHNLGFLLGGEGKRAEAEEQYRKALATFEKLAADFPVVPVYQIDLGGSYCNLGLVVGDGGRASESLGWFDKAIATLTPVHRAEPRDVMAKQYLRSSHLGRAGANAALAKHAEAVKDWDRAIELSPPAEQAGPRTGRATSLVQAGQVAEAVAEVADLTKIPGAPPPVIYDFACVYAVASGKIADKKKEYADRAMALLHKAVQAGFKDAAHMKKDSDLDALRAREDFKKLLAELEKKR